MKRFKYVLALCLVCLYVNCLLVATTIQGCEVQPNYGYSAGEAFTFTDTIIETLIYNQTPLYEETTHTILIRIESIQDEFANRIICINVSIANLADGLDSFYTKSTIEGYTPIVSGPSVYFTHTIWTGHMVDFSNSFNDFRAATQMSGIMMMNIDTFSFSWNLTGSIPQNISLYDIDQDGVNDPYDEISIYSAKFDSRGVLLVKDFINEFYFTNESYYIRHRQVSLNIGLMPLFNLLTNETMLFMGLFSLVTLSVTIITVIWYRRLSIFQEPSA